MRRFLFACSFYILVLKTANAQDVNGNNLYSRRYEKLDINAILASPRLVTNYVECLLNKKPCPPEGKALKRILPEALRTKCGRCWPSQKEGALKVITALYNNYPDYYRALREKWDPTGEYNRRFLEYIKDQKFNLINSNGADVDSEKGEQSQDSSSISVVVTQRPTRQGDVKNKSSQEEPSFIGNRFSNDNEQMADSVTTIRVPAPTRPTKVTQPPTVKPTTSRPAYNTNRLPPPATTTYVYQTQNPIINLINRLTTKFTNTAEFLSGMLRGPSVPQTT